MAHTKELSSHDLRAIIMHEMLARGTDTVTIQREELARWKNDGTLHVTQLEHSIILVAEDADTDLEQADAHDEGKPAWDDIEVKPGRWTQGQDPSTRDEPTLADLLSPAAKDAMSHDEPLPPDWPPPGLPHSH